LRSDRSSEGHIPKSITQGRILRLACVPLPVPVMPGCVPTSVPDVPEPAETLVETNRDYWKDFDRWQQLLQVVAHLASYVVLLLAVEVLLEIAVSSCFAISRLICLISPSQSVGQGAVTLTVPGGGRGAAPPALDLCPDVRDRAPSRRSPKRVRRMVARPQGHPGSQADPRG
jgi:hypothetical protein